MCLAAGRELLPAEITFQEVPADILSFCLDNVGSMQIPEHREENSLGHRSLAMKKNEPKVRKIGRSTWAQKYIRFRCRCWKQLGRFLPTP